MNNDYQLMIYTSYQLSSSNIASRITTSPLYSLYYTLLPSNNISHATPPFKTQFVSHFSNNIQNLLLILRKRTLALVEISILIYYCCIASPYPSPFLITLSSFKRKSTITNFVLSLAPENENFCSTRYLLSSIVSY